MQFLSHKRIHYKRQQVNAASELTALNFESHKQTLLKVRVSERLAREKISLALRVMEISGQGCTNFSENLETTSEFSAPEKRH